MRIMPRFHLPPGLRLGLVLVLLVGLAPAFGAVTAQADSRYFPETGHTVRGRFLAYWQTHGGLAQQGYPLTDEIQEISDTDGQVYTVQYFERAVFEAHPAYPAPYDVLLSLLGVFAYQQRYGPAGAPDQHRASDNPRFFPETGHAVGDRFRAYWESHGGLMQQGYPISDEFTEVSALDGKSYTVQYFQRAVFERHPENAGTPYEVLLSQLGTFRYQAKHAGLAIPTPGPDRTQFDPRGSDSYLVWVDQPRMYQTRQTSVILGLDLRTNQAITVTDAPRVQFLPAISGSTVVWADQGTGCPPDCATNLIRGKDLATGQSFAVGDARNGPTWPAIGGRTLAWVEFGAAERLLMRDLQSDTPQVVATLPLTNGMSFGPRFEPPVVSDEYVVWAVVRPTAVRYADAVQLLAYDRATGTTRTVSQYDERASDMPHYSLDGRRLVWLDGSGLHYADLRTGETALLWNDFHPSAPLVRGDVILWGGLGPACCSGGSIYGLHLGDRQPRVLVAGVGQDILLTVAGDWLVWQSTGLAGPEPFHAIRLATAFALAPPAPPTPTPGPVSTPAPPPTVGPTETAHFTETPSP